MPPLPDCGLIVRGKVIATARSAVPRGSPGVPHATMRREPERN